MLKKVIFFVVLCFSVGNAGELQPYKNTDEVLKDLKKSIDMAGKINNLPKSEKARYELLGRAVSLQGIMCRRAEISQFVIVQKAFEILRHKFGEINSDYIAFTENCRKMFGLYQ